MANLNSKDQRYIALLGVSRAEYLNLKDQWEAAQAISCTCHINSPCSACVQGKHMDWFEYVEAEYDLYDDD